MKESSEIAVAFETLSAGGIAAALATVVAVEGSAYRRPGARMLVAEDGRTWGGVSGGCLDRDVARRARATIGGGRPILCRYDTSDDDLIGAGTSTGCGGTIEVFVQPVDGRRPGPMPHIARVVRERVSITVATLVGRYGRMGALEAVGAPIAPSAPSSWFIGECTVLDESGRGTFGDPGAEPVVVAMASDARDVGQARLVATTAGAVFVERLVPPQALIVFGAGPDVVPLVAMAKVLGWNVTVVGSRPATALRARFAAADVLHVTDSTDPLDGVTIEHDAAVVVMTHNVERDRAILAALRGPVRYLGLLGPAHRTRRVLAPLQGVTAGDLGGLDDEHFHNPMGLDLGASAPEEIALSIVSEIHAVTRGASARPLRWERSARHDPAPADGAGAAFAEGARA